MQHNYFNTRKASKIVISTITSTSLCFWLLTAGPALGQDEEEQEEVSIEVATPDLDESESLTLEIVEVVGKMGSKNLQDTPIAISVLGGDELADQGVTNIQNLSESIPGLSLEAGAGTGGAAAPFIRGVGQRDSNETLEGGVAIYIDDVYMGRPDGALLDLIDVANIQVLRGPQGTLFGKNATGGAMVITTNRPSEEFEADVMFRAGNLGRQDMQTTINIPLIEDVLLSRLSVSSVNRDGYTKQIDPDNLSKTLDKWDNEDRQIAYARLRYLFSDYTTIDLTYQWGKQREKGRGSHCVYVGDQLVDGDPAFQHTDKDGNPTAPGKTLFRLPNGGDLTAATMGDSGSPGLPTAIGFTTAPFFQRGPYEQQCQLSEDKLDDDEFFTAMEGRYENDINLLSATFDYEMGEFAKLEETRLKTVFAWRSVDTVQNQEIDGTAMKLIDREMSHQRESDQFSFELQFNFIALDGLASGVAGFFYYHEETVNGQTDARIGPFAMTDDSPLSIEGLIKDFWSQPTNNPGVTTDFDETYDTFWFTNRAQILDTETNMMAVFSQWIFDFSEEWSATVGLRYNLEEKGLQVEYLQNTLKGSSVGYTQKECLPNDPTVSTVCLPGPGDNGTGVNLEDILFGLDLAPFFGDLTPYVEGDKVTAAHLIPPGTGFVYPAYDDSVSLEQRLNIINNDIATETISMIYQSKSDTSFTPMLNITWNGNDAIWDMLALDNGMAYLTYSRGFKSGGIVPIGIGALQEFDPEIVDNLELGFKLEMLEGALRINTAFYWMDYKDIQVTIAKADPANPVDVQIALSNAGAATIKGFENEVTWMALQNLIVILNTSYSDASYDKFDYTLVSGLFNELQMDRSDPNFCPQAESFPGCRKVSSHSEPMPWIPSWTSYLALQYTLWFESFGQISFRGDASYKGTQSGHFDYYSYLTGEWEVPEYTIYNANISWDLPDQQTKIRAWVKNIEDTRYRNGGTPIPEILGGGTYSISPPRTYGMDFAYRF